MKTPNSDIFLLMGLIKNKKYLTFKDETDVLSRNVSKKLPPLAA